jgi:hypothetical protein
MKFVIAGNHQEYINFLRDRNYYTTDYRYVTNANSLRGVMDPHGFFVGTWDKREDRDQILSQLWMCTKTHNPQLNDIIEEIDKG